MEFLNIDSSISDMFVTWFVSFFVFLWVWTILWVTKDISSRTDNLFLQILSIVVVAIWTPIFWFLIYLLLRPNRYKFDQVNWRQALDIRMIECDWCWEINDKDNDFCIYCGSNLKSKCKECKNHYPKEYDYCPSCWAPSID